MLATLALSGAAGLGMAEELLYYVEGQEVVITNTPSRADVRPVPGFPQARNIAGVRFRPSPYDPYIELVAREQGLSVELVKAVAWAESNLDPEAVSPKGAEGLMQLMPTTSAQYGVRDSFDPLQNLRAGAAHLRELLDEFGGNLTLALAAYNAGAGAVRRHAGVPDYPETRAYVRKIERRLGRRSQLPPKGARRASAPPLQVQRTADGTVLISN